MFLEIVAAGMMGSVGITGDGWIEDLMMDGVGVIEDAVTEVMIATAITTVDLTADATITVAGIVAVAVVAIADADSTADATTTADAIAAVAVGAIADADSTADATTTVAAIADVAAAAGLDAGGITTADATIAVMAVMTTLIVEAVVEEGETVFVVDAGSDLPFLDCLLEETKCRAEHQLL